jgi:hypothetical protein
LGFQNGSHGLLMLPTAILHGKVEFDFHAFSGKHTCPQGGLKLSGANVKPCSEFQGLLSGKTCVDDTLALMAHTYCSILVTPKIHFFNTALHCQFEMPTIPCHPFSERKAQVAATSGVVPPAQSSDFPVMDISQV